MFSAQKYWEKFFSEMWSEGSSTEGMRNCYSEYVLFNMFKHGYPAKLETFTKNYSTSVYKPYSLDPLMAPCQR